MVDHLWAPWRMQYIHELEAGERTDASPADDRPRCFLCDAAGHAAASDDGAARLMLHHDERGLILLNRYPYTSGHLLVAPDAHVADLTAMDSTDRADLMELIALAQRIIQLAYNPQGINVGINVGRCAGAGLPGHLHVHLVPRWAGDTNFMQVVGSVRVMPQALEQSHAQLLAAYRKLTGKHTE